MKTKRSHKRGYTLIETMMALATLTAAMAGVFALQGASSTSAREAHESGVAGMIAQTWLDRVRRDALMWTTAGLPNPAVMFPTRAGLDPLYFVPVPRANPAWHSPTPLPNANESVAFSYRGVDVGAGDPSQGGAAVPATDTYFCVNTRFESVGPLGSPNGLLAVVRVWWVRGVGALAISDVRTGGCTAHIPSAGEMSGDIAGMRAVTRSTILRQVSL